VATTGATSTAPTATSTSVVATTAAAQAGGSCQNLVATAQVKAAVTSTYGQSGTGSGAQLIHIAPAPGVFFYGECGTTAYAATRFVPTAGATLNEQVALQDDGAMMKYFSEWSGGSWSLVASQAFPGTQGCGAITQIPSALASLWATAHRAFDGEDPKPRPTPRPSPRWPPLIPVLRHHDNYWRIAFANKALSE
jgi:hypothetical protein